MHGTIFQLEEKPLKFEEDFACEEDFYDDFVGIVADYVSEDVNREEEIGYFIKYLEKYGIVYNPEEQSIIFSKNFKQKYFEGKFHTLKKIAEDLTFEDFSTGSTKLWILKNLISEKYGIYIYSNDFSWMSLDDFVRYELKEGQKFYVGSVLDYHF